MDVLQAVTLVRNQYTTHKGCLTITSSFEGSNAKIRWYIKKWDMYRLVMGRHDFAIELPVSTAKHLLLTVVK